MPPVTCQPSGVQLAFFASGCLEEGVQMLVDHAITRYSTACSASRGRQSPKGVQPLKEYR